MKVARILGVPFSTKGLQDTVQHLTDLVKLGERTHVVTANPEIVMLSQGNKNMARLMEQAYIVPDGIGIIYAARWLNAPIRERVTGVELLEHLMIQANENHWGVYLLGASPEVNEKAAEVLQERFPQAKIVGRQDGYFKPEEEARIVADIQEKKPNLLFVAMGAPKQDEWIAKHWNALPVSLAMGVGGCLDVISGKVKRAPKMWQQLHLEWFYRLVKDPSRWRRQLAIPHFVATVLWSRLKKRSESQ
ncbi:WecB/TagA/CpsF family glycosyltransferase [Brevibacillus laterosporus]|uniref:WecB/TagA/CpsF family glycosyltransferase n=1 Tax=Brevibacillus laterosporus TaxID=1465 RepID=UPI000B9B830B|nr:WecB/TagA/CpsF family glycosyltransferase [Brevibacillus laterosporus]